MCIIYPPIVKVGFDERVIFHRILGVVCAPHCALPAVYNTRARGRFKGYIRGAQKGGTERADLSQNLKNTYTCKVKLKKNIFSFFFGKEEVVCYTSTIANQPSRTIAGIFNVDSKSGAFDSFLE